jgi:GNAT superfamily N-acetyltransferase
VPFVDLALARRLEVAQTWRGVRYARARQELHPAFPVQVEPLAGGYLIYTGDGMPLNRAVGLGVNGPVTAADLDLVEEFYRQRYLPPRIDVCPLADGSLLDLLKLSGYRPEKFYSVLFYPLSESALSEPTALRPAPAEIRVSQAGPQEAELWLKTVAQGFEEADTPTQATLDILAPNFYASHAACFFAWIDGQPAGGGGMYVHERVVEFGGASTRPEFRRRGVQTALLHARLAAAREQRCDLAMALTSPGSASQRNIERLGFRLAYTKVTVMGKGEIRT